MSGGSLDYFYSQLNDHVGDFGDKELDDLVKDLAQLFHDREWYLSSDYGEGEWNEARDKFKKKWFTDIGREERVTKYLDDMRREVLKSFSIDNHYCQDCKYWKREDKGKYGRCKFAKSWSLHQCDTCERWENKNEKDTDII